MKHKIVIETPRTYLRQITHDDFEPIASILQDIEVMYAWEHIFSDDEVREWIDSNIERYIKDGCSYCAVIEKQSGKFLGVTGLLTEKAENQDYIGVAYIFKKEFWNKGFAFECASACKDYAFNNMNITLLTAQIRPENKASIKVAEKLGMTVMKKFDRHYKDKLMPHFLYGCSKE